MLRRYRLLGTLTLATASCLFAVEERKPLVVRVDHFCLFSKDSERLFQFFRDEFKLPVVWPFKNFGDFGSGGLSLGNVAFEFVTEKGEAGGAAKTELKGIAFEPDGDADAAVSELDARQIRHAEPEAYKFTQDGHERVGWVTIDLKGILPANAAIFICDYKERERVAAGKSKAAGEPARSRGGALGVTSLREIVVGVRSIEEASREWRRLIESPDQESKAVFAFGPGPKIRLEPAEAEGIQGIVIGVRSLARAREFLTQRQMLGEASEGRIGIAPAAVDGLKITLVEE
jgi:catechol 2,3-dioxygenase-like lactoylglutathione lyase family enzyme